MQKKVKFEVDNIQKINLADYEEDEFSIARLTFLSSVENSHGYIFTEEVLRKYSSTALGKWVTADMTRMVDCGTHTDNQIIVGRIPENQEIDFFYDDEGNLRVAVDAVISKIYSGNFCDIFVNDNERSVSMEAFIETDEEDEDLVTSFRILTITVLGHSYNPSVPKSNITFTRFSEQEANAFYNKVSNSDLTPLQQFAQNRKESMEKQKPWKTFKVDKSKEALSNKPWGKIDKSALRDEIMKAKNRATLVKSVYMLVEDGWEEAPSQHLKYPVMCFEGDTLVYNKGGLSSALGYAKKENETTVITKINKIYKKLGLDQEEEDKTKMAEIKFAAVNIDDLWSKLYDAINKKADWRYCIEGIYEEDNKKFVILKDRDCTLYRLDFSLTEEGLTLADEIVKVQKEFIETDTMMKFAEPEDVEKYKTFAEDDSESDDENDNDDDEPEDGNDDDKAEMSAEEMKTEMARLQEDNENKDNIIMECKNKMSEMETELAELREFKNSIEEKEKAKTVEQVMSEVKDYMSSEKYNEFRDKGLKCEMSEISGWTNAVKAFCFENGKQFKKQNDGVWRFSAPTNTQKTKKSLWD